MGLKSVHMIMGVLWFWATATLAQTTAPTLLLDKINAYGVNHDVSPEIALQIQQACLNWLPTQLSSQWQTPENETLRQQQAWQALQKNTAASHLLEVGLFGLGSTLLISLRLHDLNEPSRTVLEIKEVGKRANTTWTEVTQLAVQKLAKVAGWLPAPLVAESHEPTPPWNATPAVTAKSRPWYQHGWVWGVIGGVVAAATTVTILSLQGSDAADSPVVISGSSNSQTITTRVELQ